MTTHGDDLVFVVDDDQSVREALSSLLRSAGLPVETFSSPQEFLERARPDVPSCLILDVMLPGLSGLDLPDMLARAGREIPIVFITGQGTIPMSVRAMKAGAVEFLTKPFQDQELLSAVGHALDLDRGRRARRAELAELTMRVNQLTPREREVMALVAAGRMNKQIAAQLGTVEQTIKVHRARVMKKLGLDSVADLVRLAERLALLQGEMDPSTGVMPK